MLDYMEHYRPGPFEAAITEFYKRQNILSPQDIDLEIFAADTDIIVRERSGKTLTVRLKRHYVIFLDRHLPWPQQRVELLTWIKGQPVFQEPKTDRSRRSIALPPHTIEPIRAHRTHQIQKRLIMGSAFMDNDLVIGRVGGLPVNSRTFDGAWYRGLRRSDLPKIRFHDLRHTHASILFQLDVHPKIVSERLGHSTINITLDTYSHVLPGLQEQVAQDFGDVLFNRPKNKFIR